MQTIFDVIRVRLQLLQSILPKTVDRIIEGQQQHLNPALTEDQLQRFETEHRIALPQDYRAFLLHIGNGGTGPGYGLEMLGHAYGVAWEENPGLVGDLAKPFPYLDAWNEESIDGTRPIAEQYQQQDEYWSSKHVNGAIPICHHGCNLRECLIVTGPERGNMWFDDRADWQGLYPDKKSDRERITFLDWYTAWLEQSISSSE